MLNSQTPTLSIIIIIVTLAYSIIIRILNGFISLDFYRASQSNCAFLPVGGNKKKRSVAKILFKLLSSGILI